MLKSCIAGDHENSRCPMKKKWIVEFYTRMLGSNRLVTNTVACKVFVAFTTTRCAVTMGAE
jgi:hypothetical protein